jgi:hypothetical protein
MVKAIDLRSPKPDEPPVRRRGVAIAGRGLPPCRSWLLDEIEQSERSCSSRHRRRERRLSLVAVMVASDRAAARQLAR